MRIHSKNRIILIRAAVTGAGIIAGLAYWKYVGCLSGSCPLSASPWWNTMMGGLLGYSLSDMVVARLAPKEPSAHTPQ
jgi:hypothetical protein